MLLKEQEDFIAEGYGVLLRRDNCGLGYEGFWKDGLKDGSGKEYQEMLKGFMPNYIGTLFKGLRDWYGASYYQEVGKMEYFGYWD